MLSPDEINALRDRAEEIANNVNDFLIRDIARRIAQAGQLTSTAAYQIFRAQQLGMSRKEIEKELKKILNVSSEELRELLTQSAEVGYRFDLDRFPTAGIPFEENASLQQIVKAAVKLADKDFKNITQSLGAVTPDGKVSPIRDVYRKCTDYAFQQVVTGAADYNTAIRRATKNLADKGIRVIDYESGYHTSIEAAVRRNIMGGMGLMQEEISKANHDKFGANGWEISAHAASAPDHEPIQGKQYTDAEYEKLNNSLARRIGTLNCGHAAFPIIIGVNAPQYTEEQLEAFKRQNEEGVYYQGKHYTLYKATQKQRQIERAIRKQKNRILVDEATDDAEKLLIDRIRLTRYNEEYNAFSKSVNLPTQRERAKVAGFDFRGAKQARKTSDDEFKKVLDLATKSDRLTLSNDMEIIVSFKPFEQIEQLKGKLSNRAARRWYLSHDEMIPFQIDTAQSLEQQARQAHGLRNTYRNQARDLMSDQKERARLDREEPNKSFEELLNSKIKRKGMTRDEAIEDILKTATKTRSSVNKSLNLG